jgi:hypothetical protein
MQPQIKVDQAFQPDLHHDELDPETGAFYRHVLTILTETRLPFLIGGALALRHYTGVVRHTKDLDLFARPQDYPRILEQLAAQGYRTELTDPHWLAKIFAREDFVDVIFSSGKGLGPVDDAWFEHAVEGEVLGLPVRLCAPEEMIWSKAFIMERERYDGADIAHLLRACCAEMDWQRLLQHFGEYWRVLFSHLILFGFIYPGERQRIPAWVMLELVRHLQSELDSPSDPEQICQGTFLSNTQYLIDLERWGYQDARLRVRANKS